MSSLERMDAIASGVIALIAGGAIFVFLTPPFLNSVNEAWQQQKTFGTVIKQRPIKVQNRSPRAQIGRPATVTWHCPTIRFETEAGKVTEFETCSSGKYQINERVPVLYDRRSPTSASISQGGDSSFSWVPILFTGLPLFVGGLLVGIGACSLYRGIRKA